MQDGLYQVTYKGLCAAFVVENGSVRLSRCAPVLRSRLAFWMTVAVRIGD